MYELGKKTKIKIIKKKKGGHKVVDTSLTARRVGRPEEAGHSNVKPPIKLKIKRLASPMHSHAVLQPEHGRDKPLYPAPTHRSAVTNPQQIQEDPAVEDQETEAMPVDRLFT